MLGVKKYIRKTLRKFLGIEDLENLVASNMVELKKEIAILKRDSLHHALSLEHQGIRLHKCEELIAHTRSLLHVGVDVNPPKYGPSWCVVMVKSKDEKFQYYVNTFEIRFEDVRQLKEILKQMEGTRLSVDKPRGFLF